MYYIESVRAVRMRSCISISHHVVVHQVGLVVTLQWRSYRDLTKVSFSMSDHEEPTAVSQEESDDSRVSSPTKSLEEFQEENHLLTKDWPEGTILPLNSKRLNLSKWRAISASFELSSDATLTETRLIVEGKLTELGYDPFAVQVILSETDETALYLVNERGVIKSVSLTPHVPVDNSRESSVIDRSAQRDTSELERLRQLVSEHESAIANLQGELEAATETISELQIAYATNEKLTGKVTALKAAVEAEKLKAKRFWRLRCEQMLQEEECTSASN